MTMKHKTKRIILLILFFALVVLAVFTLWGNTALEVNKLTVKSTKIPESFNGFRIAQVSDLHNAQIGQNNSRLLSALRDSAPDIIVITGDLVDSRRTDTAVALDFAKEAVKIAPVYYVTGN
ncbi:MAG: metallophosphoesterase, partial [Clostridia bacterium]|nr:metallophosphoesterase [Clostridia bacterium]